MKMINNVPVICNIHVVAFLSVPRFIPLFFAICSARKWASLAALAIRLILMLASFVYRYSGSDDDTPIHCSMSSVIVFETESIVSIVLLSSPFTVIN